MSSLTTRSLPLLLLLVSLTSWAQDARSRLIARAAQFDLKTPYKAPPGDALSHHTSGYAKIMCFDKIGVRTMVMEADPSGNFLTQGYEFASGRDWSRLGNLYLQDGVWNGERILTGGFTTFVSTLAEPWVADGQPIYGGLLWINGDGALPIPTAAYMMQGAGGQSVTIIPSNDLVIVRLGHYKGAQAGAKALNKAYALLMEAVPKTTKP